MRLLLLLLLPPASKCSLIIATSTIAAAETPTLASTSMRWAVGTEARVAGAGDNLENDNDDDNLYTIHVDLALCRMSTRATTENTAKEWLR